MIHRAGQDVGDGLDARVRMPGKPGAVVVRAIVAKVVEQQERIELAGVAEAEGAVKLYAGAFHGRRGLDDPLHRSNGHDGHLSLSVPLYLGTELSIYNCSNLAGFGPFPTCNATAVVLDSW